MGRCLGIPLRSRPLIPCLPARRGLSLLRAFLLVPLVASVVSLPSVTLTQVGTDPVTVSASKAAIDLLDRQSHALLRGDALGWSVGVDPGATDFAARHAAVFDRLADLPVTRWGYEILQARRRPDSTVPVGVDATVEVRVQLFYRLAPDSRDLVRDRTLTLVRRAGQWSIVSDSDGPTRWDLWELGPVIVRRTEHCLLVADISATDLVDQILAETEAATALLRDLWPAQRMPVPVILVAADPDQASELLPGIERSTLASIVAATTGPLDRTPGLGVAPVAMADRVVLDAAMFRDLTGPGRHVVLTHELTHVFTRATAVVAPPAWLEEGIADYVAYLGTGLSAQLIVGEMISAVGHDRLPPRLPGSADFSGTHHGSDLCYEQAWSAVALISGLDPGAGAGTDPRTDPVAARHWQRLRRFYRVATAQRLEPGAVGTNSRILRSVAFARVLGMTESDFVNLWQRTVLGMVSSLGTEHDH